MGGTVAAVANLSRSRESVRREALRGPEIARRWRAVEHVDIMLAVLHTVPQNVDDATLADFTLQTGEELLARWAVGIKIECRQQQRLRRGNERAELDQIDGPCRIITLRIACQPSTVGHVVSDELLKALLAGVGSISGRRILCFQDGNIFEERG